MEALVALAVIALAAGLLATLVGGIMRRFGITPTDESARSEGFGDVLRKLREWSDNRRN